MDMLVEKLTPPLGVPGKLPEDYRPGRPSIYPNRAQIKDCIDNKTVEKKGAPTPSGRAHHRWCSEVGRKIGGAFQEQVAFTKGWMTGHVKRPLNVSVLFRGCGFEICEWLLAESIPPKKLGTYPRSGSKSKGPNCRNWDMLAVFGSMVPKKVAMHSPGNPGKRQYRVDMLVDTWNASPRHVCSRECNLQRLAPQEKSRITRPVIHR